MNFDFHFKHFSHIIVSTSTLASRLKLLDHLEFNSINFNF